MRSPALPLAVLAVVLAAAAPASAQQVYKWKDARGVTHYGERPPASGNYSTVDAVKDPGADTGATSATAASGDGATAAAAPSTAPDPRCNTARANLAALQGNDPVQMDSDGDGKPDKALDEAGRNSQMELARATLRAYNCSETAASG